MKAGTDIKVSLNRRELRTAPVHGGLEKLTKYLEHVNGGKSFDQQYNEGLRGGGLLVP